MRVNSIVSAWYGTPDKSKGKDVTAVLQANFEANHHACVRLSSVNNPSMQGDTLPGVPKVLTVVYVVGGVEKSVVVNEGRPYYKNFRSCLRSPPLSENRPSLLISSPTCLLRRSPK
jgi:hypothetical protein